MACSSTSWDSAWEEGESVRNGFVPYHRQYASDSTHSIPPVLQSDYEIPLSRRANAPLKLGQDGELCRSTPHGEYSSDGRSRYQTFVSGSAMNMGPQRHVFDIEGFDGETENLPFDLDTGSMSCSISKRLADALGLGTRL